MGLGARSGQPRSWLAVTLPGFQARAARLFMSCCISVLLQIESGAKPADAAARFRDLPGKQPGQVNHQVPDATGTGQRNAGRGLKTQRGPDQDKATLLNPQCRRHEKAALLSA